MSSSPSLRDAQRRNWQLMNYEDGFWDLLFGLVLMTLAVYPVTRARLGPVANFALFVGEILLLVVAQYFVRQRVTTPRLGFVKPRRTRGKKVILVIMTLLVGFTVALAIATLVGSGSGTVEPTGHGSAAVGGKAWVRSYVVEIVVMMAMVVLFSIMGYVFGVSRLYLYGWLLGGANLASVVLNTNAPDRFNLPLGLAAGIILVIGSVLLLRFLRKYPVRSAEA